MLNIKWYWKNILLTFKKYCPKSCITIIDEANDTVIKSNTKYIVDENIW